MNIRKIALTLLTEYEAGGKYVNLSLSSHLCDTLSPAERAQLTVLLYTTVEQKLRYDYYIKALSARGGEEIDMTTLNILRLGVCQILDMRSVPDYAAVSETVELARNRGERAFINGVLRTLVRQKGALPEPSEEKNYKRYLSVKYSFPLWLVKHFDSLYGRAGCEALLSAFNTARYTDITVNTLKISREKYLEKLEACGVFAEKSTYTGEGIRIKSSVNPDSLPGFSDGEFLVQDTASLLAVTALSPKRGERIIDVCAAPGGKSLAAAVLSGDTGEVYSFDLHESKLSLIESSALRLGVKSLKVRARDARTPDEALIGTADKLIVDAPCSGLGVLSKKPDLRYKSCEVLRELPELQLEILTASSKYLKAGGELIYSTCTLNPEENSGVVERFLSENPDFEPVKVKIGDVEASEHTLLPHIHGTDGFFIAKIRKKRI